MSSPGRGALYFWVLEAEWEGHRMFWRHDDSGYYVLYDTNNTLPDEKIIDGLKAIMPPGLRYEADGWAISEFRPRAPTYKGRDVPTYLVVLKTTNGLSTVGPTWASSTTPHEFAADAHPCVILETDDLPPPPQPQTWGTWLWSWLAWVWAR